MFQKLSRSVDALFPVRYFALGLCALGVLLALFSLVAFGVGWVALTLCAGGVVLRVGYRR